MAVPVPRRHPPLLICSRCLCFWPEMDFSRMLRHACSELDHSSCHLYSGLLAQDLGQALGPSMPNCKCRESMPGTCCCCRGFRGGLFGLVGLDPRSECPSQARVPLFMFSVSPSYVNWAWWMYRKPQVLGPLEGKSSMGPSSLGLSPHFAHT